MQLARFGCRRLATASLSKFGRAVEVVSLTADTQVKSLGDQEVAIKFLAAPITSQDLQLIQGHPPALSLPAVPGTEGVGVVTAVGSNVTGLSVNDWVIPGVPAFGSWRSLAKAKASDVVKVSSSIPVEFAASINVPLIALRVLEDFGSLGPDDVVLQAGAETAVGKAVIQLAKLKGIRTINIVSGGPGYHEAASFIKELGGDIVMSAEYAASPAFTELLADYTKPKLGIIHAGSSGVDSGVWKLLSPGATVVSLGADKPSAGNIKSFSLAIWYKNTAAEAKLQALATVSKLMEEGAVKVWLERYSLSDIKYALEQASQPFRTREVVLTINDPPESQDVTPKVDLATVGHEFERLFSQIRA